MPILVINTDYTKTDWNDDGNYYRDCFSGFFLFILLWSIYSTSYTISICSSNNNIVDGFHLCFTVRRLLRRMEGGEKMSDISRELNAGKFYRNIEHIRRNMIYKTKGGVVYDIREIYYLFPMD